MGSVVRVSDGLIVVDSVEVEVWGLDEVSGEGVVMSRRTDTLPKGRVDHGTISVSIRTIGVGGCWCQSREANKFEKVVEKLYFNVTEAISKERGGKWALRRGRAGCHLHSNESSALCVLKRWRKVWLKLGAPGQSSVGHQCWLERVGIDGSLFGESVSGWRGSVLFNPTEVWCYWRMRWGAEVQEAENGERSSLLPGHCWSWLWFI